MTSPSRARRYARRTGGVALVLAAAFTVALFATTGCLSAFGQRPDAARMAALAKQSSFDDGRFVNREPEEAFTPSLSMLIREGLLGREQRQPPSAVPLEDPRAAWAAQPATGLRVTWLGHSTLLVEQDGFRVLTDPVWGNRASPSTLVGPLRFHPPPVPLAELPPLDAVIISHDHYDHLDMPSIKALADLGVPFYVPLGVAAHLVSWGVPEERITELDWWGEAEVKDGLTLIATPSRHFSGRGLADRDRTLWASWVIRTPRRRAYFSGDTGLTPQFRDIGERLGPFDLVMLEVGAFHPAWGDIHLGPEGALDALEWLGGGPLLPIHWGTFNLAFHAWDDPAERLAALAKERGVRLLTPRPGGSLEPGAAPPVDPWWREVSPAPKRDLSSVPTF